MGSRWKIGLLNVIAILGKLRGQGLSPLLVMDSWLPSSFYQCTIGSDGELTFVVFSSKLLGIIGPLLKAGLPLYAINPFQVRSFARSIGRRAKTDAVDARVLAMMASAIEDLRPTEARSEGQRELAELQQIRDALRKDRVATTNRGRHLRTPVGKRVTKQRLRKIERQLKVIDAEIRRRLGEEKALERRAEILTSIPGISDITAAGLIVHIPELGTLTGPRAASLAGLAPVTRESGHWRGRSFIKEAGTGSAGCYTCPRWSRSTSLREKRVST